MKISKSLIAIAVVATLPLAAIAGDKDKTSGHMGTASEAHFAKLDTNRDGRISQAEAASDPQLVFTTVDKNSDGFLDNSEYSKRDMSRAPMPHSTDPASETATPRQ